MGEGDWDVSEAMPAVVLRDKGRCGCCSAVCGRVCQASLSFLRCGRGADGMFLLESSRSDPRWTLLFPGARAFWG